MSDFDDEIDATTADMRSRFESIARERISPHLNRDGLCYIDRYSNESAIAPCLGECWTSLSEKLAIFDPRVNLQIVTAHLGGFPVRLTMERARHTGTRYISRVWFAPTGDVYMCDCWCRKGAMHRVGDIMRCDECHWDVRILPLMPAATSTIITHIASK